MAAGHWDHQATEVIGRESDAGGGGSRRLFPSGRGGRVAVAAFAALVLVATLVAVLLGRTRPPTPPSVAPPSSAQRAGSPPPGLAYIPFAPPTRPAGGGEVSMPVTFPDGTAKVIRYPARLGLARLGVRPVAWARHGDEPERALFVLRRETGLFSLGRPVWVRRLAGGHGRQVGLWRVPGRSGVDIEFLVFTFGRWRVAVLDENLPEMLFAERTGWATHLRGRETPTGFLALAPTGPLRVSGPGDTRSLGGGPAGPQLLFGGLRRGVGLRLDDPGCPSADDEATPPAPPDGRAGSACRDGVLVSASGDEAFVGGVLGDVRVERP